MRSMSSVAFCLAGALALGSASVGTFQQLTNSSSPVCDVTGYRQGAGPVARASNGSTFIEWGVVRTADLRPFGARTFTIPFDGSGQKWVRFAAWDSAGNGALTMPMRLGTQ